MAPATETTPLSGCEDLASISDRAVRHGFIQKVLGILGVQLLTTCVVAGLITIFGEKLVVQNPSLVVVLMAMSAVTLLSVHCVFMSFRETMRKSPQNYVLLALFTLAKGVLLGFICLQYTIQSVLVLVLITGIVTLGLMRFAFQSTYDFTGFLPYMFACCLALVLMGLCLAISARLGAASTGAFKTLNIVYASMGALFCSFGIILHTQMILGDKSNKYRYRLDDYCMAAIALYANMVHLFQFLLRLLGQRK